MIRRAEVSDHPWIVATGAEAYADLGDYTRILPSWLDQAGVLAWIDHDLQGRGRGFAMLGFYMEAGTAGAPAQVVADLLALAVLPSQRGHGIGGRLLAHVIGVAERVAPTSNITALRLSVAETNTAAQRMYARAGFRMVEGAATYDSGQCALRMARPLGVSVTR